MEELSKKDMAAKARQYMIKKKAYLDTLFSEASLGCFNSRK